MDIVTAFLILSIQLNISLAILWYYERSNAKAWREVSQLWQEFAEEKSEIIAKYTKWFEETYCNYTEDEAWAHLQEEDEHRN